MISDAPSHRRHRRNPFLRLIGWLMLASLVLPIAATGATAVAFAGVRALPAYREVDTRTLLGAFRAVTISEIGESPRFAPQAPTGAVPICRDVERVLVKPLRAAFGLMRGTSEGRRLFSVLVDEGVCVDVRDLPYNAAYAESRRSGANDWSESAIVIDRDIVRITRLDVLAAVLIHEATHIDRAVSGEACFLPPNSCAELANGVDLDEEIAAHTAEAKWWIAAFGKNGKRFAFRDDYGENRLARAYLAGPSAFRAYVLRFRSDPREGEGITER